MTDVTDVTDVTVRLAAPPQRFHQLNSRAVAPAQHSICSALHLLIDRRGMIAAHPATRARLLPPPTQLGRLLVRRLVLRESSIASSLPLASAALWSLGRAGAAVPAALGPVVPIRQVLRTELGLAGVGVRALKSKGGASRAARAHEGGASRAARQGRRVEGGRECSRGRRVTRVAI